jgi:hypothetical protein
LSTVAFPVCPFFLFGNEFVKIRRYIYNSLNSQVTKCDVLKAGRWFFPGTPVSSTNKTDHHDITDILPKVTLSTINQPYILYRMVKDFLLMFGNT